MKKRMEWFWMSQCFSYAVRLLAPRDEPGITSVKILVSVPDGPEPITITAYISRIDGTGGIHNRFFDCDPETYELTARELSSREIVAVDAPSAAVVDSEFKADPRWPEVAKILKNALRKFAIEVARLPMPDDLVL